MSQSRNEGSYGRKTAHILAIGTAIPPNYILQDDYPDFFFKISSSEHKVELKEKFKRICEKSNIRKRHFHLTEKILKENPKIATYGAASLESRQKIIEEEIPKLGAEAATIAIKEWGKPLSQITHVVFATISSAMMPGPDYALTKLLKLSDNVQRVMLYFQGCYAGGTALRVARDMAENNAGARVLVVCAESTAIFFHGPNENHLDELVGQAIFGDGASAMVVGAEPKDGETALFEMLSAHQMIVPNTEHVIVAHFYEMGMTYCLKKDMVDLFRQHMDGYMKIAFEELGISDWSSLFYAIHPGGRGIIDAIVENLGLNDQTIAPTRHILSEYGNMSSTSLIFVLDELRRRAKAENKPTTGDGKEYGCAIGLGPGITMECIVLRSCPTA